jgi:hypothetical protein
MLTVLSVNDNGSALISTEGLYRVEGGGEIIGEMERLPIAEAIAEGWTNGDPEHRPATISTYAEVAHSLSNLSAILISSAVCV